MKAILMICPLIILIILSSMNPCHGQDGKVINGKPVDPPHKYPWLVSMQKGDKHSCGGTIWDKYWIVTAGHCVRDKEGGPVDLTQIKWVTGLHKRTAPSNWSQTVSTAAVIVHPLYDKEIVFADIAMVRVFPPILFSDKVTPSNFIPFDFDNYTSINYTATVAGWGRVGTEEGAELADELLEVDIPVYTLESCQRYLSSFQRPGNAANYSAAFTEDHICAGPEEGGSGSCYGDSGGPLMVYDNVTLLWTQVGIVSWAAGCGAKRAPTVYTRVNRYYRWMNQVTRSCKVRNIKD